MAQTCLISTSKVSEISETQELTRRGNFLNSKWEVEAVEAPAETRIIGAFLFNFP